MLVSATTAIAVRVGEPWEEVWKGEQMTQVTLAEGFRGLGSTCPASRDLLDGSFCCAILIQIRFFERARMLNSSERCLNKADLLLRVRES